MSGRYKDYKGSSRSARDDSRLHSARERSRSPRRRKTPPSSSRGYSPPPPPLPPKIENREKQIDLQQRDHKDENIGRKSPDGWESSEEEVPAPPPPPRISKISIGFSKSKAPIKMNLGGPVKAAAPKPTVASVFADDDDDDDEPEEMPAEAKMRMRNIGRETPTSAGPNSFGKTKQGFCDAKKVFEKNLKHALETVEGRKTMPKFPQTIYKINEGAN